MKELALFQEAVLKVFEQLVQQLEELAFIELVVVELVIKLALILEFGLLVFVKLEHLKPQHSTTSLQHQVICHPKE